ncbi:hypothetical protein DPMN_084074 [Dreissena polymorpha]|uniref:Uncharacterized protein n=1 Tax=Dreissena polymorpha TaxID=45954 RepID=A0A9D3Y9X6_DREPO|nr:hypothetical protein DPMN_084074 [Dreissena polymorpha]
MPDKPLKQKNVLKKFHDDTTKHVSSRLLTKKTAPSPGGHAFRQTTTIYKLCRAIIRAHALTKFHEDWIKIVTFGEITANIAPDSGSRKPKPLFAGTTARALLTMFLNGTEPFKLDQDIIATNLIKFHEDRIINMILDC